MTYKTCFFRFTKWRVVTVSYFYNCHITAVDRLTKQLVLLGEFTGEEQKNVRATIKPCTPFLECVTCR
jgi:hypothetical protein